MLDVCKQHMQYMSVQTCAQPQYTDFSRCSLCDFLSNPNQLLPTPAHMARRTTTPVHLDLTGQTIDTLPFSLYDISPPILSVLGISDHKSNSIKTMIETTFLLYSYHHDKYRKKQHIIFTIVKHIQNTLQQSVNQLYT